MGTSKFRIATWFMKECIAFAQDPSDGPAHFVCADGTILQVDKDGKVITDILTSDVFIRLLVFV